MTAYSEVGREQPRPGRLTLGDLGALAQIKERLQKEEKGGGANTNPETPTAE